MNSTCRSIVQPSRRMRREGEGEGGEAMEREFCIHQLGA
jgi:hypothetical protein